MGSALPFALISYGELYVQSGLAALLMGIAPVATVLLAPLTHHDEKLTISSIAGIGAGVIGLIFLLDLVPSMKLVRILLDNQPF